MPDDIPEYEHPAEDSQTGRHPDGDRTVLPGTIDPDRSITRRNALLGGGSLAVATLLNRSGTVAEELRSDSLSEATATDTQTTDDEQVQYTLTVTDSEGNEVGSATVTGVYDLSNLGQRITFGVFGDFAGDGDNAVVDYVRLGDGTVVENWSDRTLEDDYTKTRDNDGEFDLVSSPTADGPRALRMFTGFDPTEYTSNDDLLPVESGLTVKVDFRHETDASDTFAMRSSFAFGTGPDGKGSGDHIQVDMANPGLERAEGGGLRTPNGNERIEFVPDLEEFYTFSVGVSTSPSDEPRLRLDSVRPVQAVFNTTLTENMDLVAGKDTALLVYPTVENLESLADDTEITLSVTGQVEDSADSDLSWEGTLPGSEVTLTKDDLDTFVSEIKEEETPLDRTEFFGRELESGDGIPELPLSGTVEIPETVDAAEQEKTGTLDVSASTDDSSVRIEADTETDVTVHRTGAIRVIMARSEGVDDSISTPKFSEFYRHVEEYLKAVFPVSKSNRPRLLSEFSEPVPVDFSPLPPPLAALDVVRDLDEWFWNIFEPVPGAETFFLVIVTPSEMADLAGAETTGFTDSSYETMLVLFGNEPTVAHELGHQFDLHIGRTEGEEYAITDTVEHTVDGYWVNQPDWVPENATHAGYLRQHLSENNDAAAPYMARGDEPNRGWPSNTEDYETKSTGLSSTTERRDFGEPFETLKDTYTAATPARASNNLTTRQDSSHGPGFSVAAPEDRVLYFKAAITAKEDVELGNLHYYEDARPVETDPTGEFSLVGTADDGATLVDKPFSVPESVCTVPDGDLTSVETAPVSFAVAYPAGITTIEIRRKKATGESSTTADAEQTTLATFDPRVEVLRGELVSIPDNGFEAGDPDTIQGIREDLQEIVDDIEASYEDGDDEAAGELIQTEFEPALDEALRDDYEANEPLERSRQSIQRSVEDTVARSVNPIVPYTNEDGIVDTDGLRVAIDDWRAGGIDTGLLRDVIDAWRTGEPVV